MKKLSIYAISLLIIISCAERTQFTLRGKMVGVNTGTIILERLENGEPVVIDSVQVKNGKFKLKGSVKDPEMVTLIYLENKTRLPLFLENSNIQISFNIDTVKNSLIEGSLSHNEIDTYYFTIYSMREQLTALYKEIINANKSNSKDTVLIKKLKLDFDSIKNELYSYSPQYILNNNKSYVAAYIANKHLFYTMNFKNLDTLINNFDSSLHHYIYYKDLKYKIGIKKRTAIGQPFPDIVLNDTTGLSVAIYSLVGTSKLLLVDFWADWCEGCKIKNKNLIDLYKTYKDKGFEIIGISFDDNKTEWTNAIKENKIAWLQISDLQGKNSPLIKYLGLQSIPYHFLLDESGIIIEKGSSYKNEILKSKLDEYLN